jgi:hypothetical protein
VSRMSAKENHDNAGFMFLLCNKYNLLSRIKLGIHFLKISGLEEVRSRP